MQTFNILNYIFLIYYISVYAFNIEYKVTFKYLYYAYLINISNGTIYIHIYMYILETLVLMMSTIFSL